jgi:hypothetical protein
LYKLAEVAAAEIMEEEQVREELVLQLLLIVDLQ